MYLFLSSKASNILFEGWNSKGFPDMMVMFTVTVMIAILYESFRLLHAFIHIKGHQNPILYNQEQTEATSETSTSNSLQALILPLSTSTIKRKRRLYYIAATFMHMVLTFLGYLIMLLVMTFNGWFAIAVLFGASLGYFLFDSAILNLVYRSPNTPSRYTTPSSDVPSVTHNTEFVSRTSDLLI